MILANTEGNTKPQLADSDRAANGDSHRPLPLW